MTRLPAIHPGRLLAGLAVGLLAGMLVHGRAAVLLAAVLLPIGRLWLDALTMTVVPLVFGLLVTAIATVSRDAAAGSVTWRALVCFTLMLLAACLVAAPLAELLLRWWPVTAGALDGAVRTAPPPSAPVPWYETIIPANPIKAASETAMLPVVVFSLFLGFALSRIERDRADTLLRPLRALVDALLLIVSWTLLVGPIGILALAFGAGAALGASVLGVLAQYVLVVVACCLAAAVLGYVWVAAASRRVPIAFARAALPVPAVALGTQSSLATLPVMIRAGERLGIGETTGGIVLPLAVSLFRASSAAANVAVALYVAHASGIVPTPAMLATAALVAVPVSLGAVGLPAQVSFFATIAPVCIAIGAPVTVLPLLLAIEALPDLFRTLGNVTNDLAAAELVRRWRPAATG